MMETKKLLKGYSPIIQQYALHLHELLQEWQFGTDEAIAGMLLPVVKSGGAVEQYPSTIVDLCCAAAALIFDPSIPEHEKQRRLYMAAYQNLNALLIALAYRLVSLARFDDMVEIDRINWAKENVAVYLPVFNLLGLTTYASALGDISSRVIDKKHYTILEKQVQAYYEQYTLLFSAIHQRLLETFERDRLYNVKVKPFELNPAATQPEHLIVDVLVENARDCYIALGEIHQVWQPLNQVTDYIAEPRYNGYRALITQVMAKDPDSGTWQSVEFHIRTYEMEQTNTHGVIAARLSETPLKNVWWNQSELVLEKPLCVFTPTGELMTSLSKGATVVDFAFKIHSDLGVYAAVFKVNGRRVQPHHVLRHCDLVEIEYDKHYPSVERQWEDYAQIRSVKRAIRRYFKLKDRHPHAGRRLLDHVLEREMSVYEMRFSPDIIQSKLEKLAVRLGYASVDLMYMKVSTGEVSPDEIVAWMIEDELIQHIVLQDGRYWEPDKIRLSRSWMQEKEGRKWERATRIMPGVEIVGRFQHEQLIVYRKDDPHAPVDCEPLSWRAGSTRQDTVEVFIDAAPSWEALRWVIDALSPVTLHRLQYELDDIQANISFIVDAPSFDRIQTLEQTLRSLKDQMFIKDFRVWQVFPGQKVVITGKTDRRRKNPYTLRQIRDRGMFFGRESEINRVIDYLNEGETFIVLYGQKRIGKTSLMHQLAENILPETCDVLPILFDVHSLSPFTVEGFLYNLSEAVYNILKQGEQRRGLRLSLPDLANEPFSVFADWVNQVENRLQGKKLLFIIDEFTKAEEEYQRERLSADFFNGLQWLVGVRHIGFFICVHEHIYRTGTQSWGVLQRGNPIHLSALDRVSTAQLIQQPLGRLYKVPMSIVDEILDLTNCHPFFVQAICLELTIHMAQAQHDQISDEDLRLAISTVLRSGHHYFSHFQSEIDEFTLNVLKCIAYLSAENNQWIDRQGIHDAMEEFWEVGEHMQLSQSIGNLYQSGVIEVQNMQGVAKYRIPIKLFQFWLRQRTHPLVVRDMQK